jgi:LysM repeat protein
VDRICPLLAMAADRRTVCAGYDPNHRCWSSNPLPVLDRRQQLTVCLTAAHVSCPHLVGQATADQSIPPDQRVGPSRIIFEPDSSLRGLASRSTAAHVSRRAVAAGLLVVVTTGAGAVSGTLGRVGDFAADLQSAAADAVGPLVSPGHSWVETTPSPSPMPTPSFVPEAVPSVDLTQAPQPTTPEPTPAATPVTTPATTPVTATPDQRRYVVQPGDTLGAIAHRFGVTVAALQAANGINDQNVISVGQVLIIP